MVAAHAERRVPDQIQGRNPHHVNQDEELAAAMTAARRGDGNRIVVFTGGPGVGKTAIAIELSFRLREAFPGGRLFGQLSEGLDQPGVESELLRGFLLALGERDHDIPDRLDARRARYQAVTAGAELLVLLDGAVSASQVRALLPGDGESLVVVTERRPLSALAADSAVTFVDLSPLRDGPARELLGRLAGADRVTAETEAVDEVIRLCGNLPIALCVVGALVRRSGSRTFSVTVEQLRDERRRLSALSRDDELSVTSVFTTAYRLLDASAQRCYRAAGLRPRTAEIGVEAMAAALDLPGYQVRDALAELSDFGLVEDVAVDRIGIRELVQIHAEKLDPRPAAERHVEVMRLLMYYLGRTAAADDVVSPLRPWRDKLFPDVRRGEPFDNENAARHWLRTERANLCAAVEHAFDIGEFALVVQWSVLLWPFHEKEKYIEDLITVNRLGVKAAWRLSDSATESLLHVQLGFAHYWLRELDAAVVSFDKGLTLAVDARDVELEATAVEGLGLAILAREGMGAAAGLLRRNLDLAVRIGDPRRQALARFHLAKALAPRPALALLDESGQLFRSLGRDETDNLTKITIWRGKKLIEDGRADGVESDLIDAVNVMNARGRRFDQAEALTALGDLAVSESAPDKAAGCYREALAIQQDLGFDALAEMVSAKLVHLRSTGSP